MNLDQRMDATAFWLMEEFPAPYPVRVRFVKYIKPSDEDGPVGKAHEKVGDMGECWIKDGRCFIDVSRRRCKDHDWLTETLIHEWAHLISAKQGCLENLRDSFHDAEWGVAYARIYRAYFERRGYEEVREIAKRFKKAAAATK